MSQVQQLLTEHLDIWTAAEIEKKSGRGRASGSAGKVYGIQKLRGLILDLAVSGKLVQGDSLNFRKLTLGELGEWGSGGTPLKSQHEFYSGNIPWLVIGDLNDGLVLNSETKITKLGLENSSAKVVPIGTLLIAMYGSIGKLGIAGIECATNQAIAFCIPNNNIVLTNYLFLYLRSIRDKLLARGQGLAQQNISQKILKATWVSIPPLAEQHRIVAKVDELMVLCDQLERQHSNAAEAHEKLVEHLLGTLTQAQNAQDFNSQWQRIYAHFDTLFTTEASIDALKETLLQLAVMGKLVPQDPNDETASELLKRIQAEKTKLVAEGKVKKGKLLPEISKEELCLSELPSGWSFARWGQISDWITYGFTRPMPHERKGIPIITGKNVNNGRIIFESADFTTTEAFNELNDKDRPIIGDILITKDGSIGRTAIVETNELFCINQSVAVIWLRSCNLSRKFLKLVLDCPQSQFAFESKAEGVAIKHISVVDLGIMVLPIPPLGEQHRIVAKVDELMALCDQLQTRIQQASQQQQQLADVLIAQVLA